MDPPGLRALSAPAVVKRVFILVNMACYLVFCHLMMAKLELLESYYRTGANSTEMTTANSCVGECSPQWMAVFLPIWIADLLNVVMHLAFFYVRLAWTPTTSMHNARIEHITGLCRSLLYALFKLLLVKQLQIVAAPPGTSNNPQAVAWWVVFWPTYLAAFLQLVLHLRKHLEPSPAHRSPPRRPGFSISVFDLLAINISCKLEDAFYIPHASWASVLWPLWVAAAFGAIAIFLGICLALPLLRRQVSTAQIAFVMPPVVLLVASYTFGLQGLTALTGWLDGDKSIRVFAIAQPIASAGWSLTLLLTIVAISSLFHPMAVVEHQVCVYRASTATRSSCCSEVVRKGFVGEERSSRICNRCALACTCWRRVLHQLRDFVVMHVHMCTSRCMGFVVHAEFSMDHATVGMGFGRGVPLFFNETQHFLSARARN